MFWLFVAECSMALRAYPSMTGSSWLAITRLLSWDLITGLMVCPVLSPQC